MYTGKNNRLCEQMYIFPWGKGPCSIVQIIDGSRAAYCTETERGYWLYCKDGNLSDLVDVIEMSDNEQDEVEYLDILSDLAQANQRGMYPEVSDEIRQILIGRQVRREMAFILNTQYKDWIKENKGIIYLLSRKAINFISDKIDVNTAVGMAVNLKNKILEEGYD